MVRGARRESLKKTKRRQLTLGIGCDGQQLVLTDQALTALMTVDGERIEDYTNITSSNHSVENVTFSYEVKTVDLFHMFGGKGEEKSEGLSREVVAACEQRLAELRTAYEAQARQAILFAINDPAIDALLGWVGRDVTSRYDHCELWKDKHHVNEYGFAAPYLRAFIWERVANRALLYLSGYAARMWNPHLEDKDARSIDCAFIEAVDDWYFTSHIHLSQLSEEASEFLRWPFPYPIDMLDVPKADLIDTVYPDLCWEVGWLRTWDVKLYDRLMETYGPKCFDWQKLRVGLH